MSIVPSLYDPLGLLAPIIVEWNSFYRELLRVSEVKVTCWIDLSLHSRFEIYGFSDASRQAMCATIYFRILGKGSSEVNSIVAKTRVSALKTQTISRLELCDALIIYKLVSGLLKSFEFSNVPLHLWLDSTVALA